MRKKKVIISADDFGLSDCINEAVIKGFKDGILKSASILPNARRTSEAARLAAKNPHLDIGVHLCLVQGKPVSTPDKTCTLVNGKGYFYLNHKDFLLRLWVGKINLDEVENEFEAQIRKILDYNLSVSHLDTHQHLHIHPGILRIVIKLAKRFNIRWIRYPLEINPNYGEFYSPFLRLDTFAKFFFGLINRSKIENIFSLSGVSRSDYLFGMYHAGSMNYAIFKKMLLQIRPGLTEIIFHPATKNEDFSEEFPDSFRGFDWVSQFNALISPMAKELAASNNVNFISFKDATL